MLFFLVNWYHFFFHHLNILTTLLSNSTHNPLPKMYLVPLLFTFGGGVLYFDTMQVPGTIRGTIRGGGSPREIFFEIMLVPGTKKGGGPTMD